MNKWNFLLLILFPIIVVQSCKKENEHPLLTQNFIDRAVSSQSFAIAAGSLAAEKGVDPQVRVYGAQLVKEHTTASAELANLVELKGWVLPAYMYVKDQVRLDLLHEVSVADFDKEFVKIMTQSHEETIDLFTEAAENPSVKDSDLRNFAGNKIPVLKTHLEIALELQK